MFEDSIIQFSDEKSTGNMAQTPENKGFFEG